MSSKTALHPVPVQSVFMTEPFFVCIRPTADVLEICLDPGAHVLQVFTHYLDEQEECIATWHHPQRGSWPKPEVMRSIANVIRPGYPGAPDTPIEQIEQWYISNRRIFRNCLSESGLPNEETEAAIRFVFVTRILKEYTKDFTKTLKCATMAVFPALAKALKIHSIPHLQPSISTEMDFSSLKQRAEDMRLSNTGRIVELQLQKAKIISQAHMEGDFSGAPQRFSGEKELEERLAIMHHVGELSRNTSEIINNLLQSVVTCRKYLDSIPRNPFSNKVETTIQKLNTLITQTRLVDFENCRAIFDKLVVDQPSTSKVIDQPTWKEKAQNFFRIQPSSQSQSSSHSQTPPQPAPISALTQQTLAAYQDLLNFLETT